MLQNNTIREHENNQHACGDSLCVPENVVSLNGSESELLKVSSHLKFILGNVVFCLFPEYKKKKKNQYLFTNSLSMT